MDHLRILKRSIAAHQAAMEAGEYSALALTEMFLEQIRLREPLVGAYLTVDEEGARRAASESDERRACGKTRGVLDGIPYAVKDNFCTAGLPTTCASKMLEHYVPPYDATVICRLREQGAVLLGKLNMDEFAMGSSTEHSALGVTRNPHDPSRVPGGSSGGSAAAVAADEAVFTLGSDTGGSVRQPAAFCGVLGLKPTYGAISRYGLIAMASSLDAVGLCLRHAEDGEAVLSALVGRDPMDATSLDYKPAPPIQDRPLRVAVIGDFLRDGMVSPGIRGALEASMDALRQTGAILETVALPAPHLALAAYSVLAAAEVSSNLARFDGVHYGLRKEGEGDLRSLYSQSRSAGFGEETCRRILFGTYVLTGDRRSRFYHRALQVREDVFRAMGEILSCYDLVLSPTTPSGAFLSGTRPAPEEMYRADLCTVYASLASLPALAIPMGRNDKGMPVSVQLTAGKCGEGLLLDTARMLEVYCEQNGL